MKTFTSAIITPTFAFAGKVTAAVLAITDKYQSAFVVGGTLVGVLFSYLNYRKGKKDL